MTAERAPRPGERCQCGRPAVTVFLVEHRPDGLPWCGIPDGGTGGERPGGGRADTPLPAPREPRDDR